MGEAAPEVKAERTCILLRGPTLCLRGEKDADFDKNAYNTPMHPIPP